VRSIRSFSTTIGERQFAQRGELRQLLDLAELVAQALAELDGLLAGLAGRLEGNGRGG
jgi:hypothetical protein